jgi:capsular exopolysaccharide synthesis family protein
MFRMIERRVKEVDLVRMMQRNNVAIVEQPRVPVEPVLPKVPINLAVSFILSLILALALALLVEAFDTTVKSQSEIERDLGVPYLGMIPVFSKKLESRLSSRGPARGQAFNRDTFVIDFPKSTMAEACRSIRTNLLFMASEQPLRSLVVTSAGPREGKTTASISIASVTAQSGTGVLLIDADMRKPRLHSVFGIRKDIGFSSVLMGEASLDEVLHQTDVPNLTVMACGPVPQNPSELLHTDRFREMLAELSSRYGLVIIDSPPLVPVTDAAILGGQVDGVIVIVKAGSTRKELVSRAVDSLRSVKANVLGAVLNGVDLERGSGGGRYYYYRHYGHYYGEAEASPTSTPS